MTALHSCATRGLAALAALLVVSACVQAPDAAHDADAPTLEATVRAASGEAPPTENGIYIARGVCFGEGGCPWVHWRASEPVALRERIDAAAPVIATIAAGEWVAPVEGQLRLAPQRGVVRTAHNALEAGDVIYLLESQGEGEFVIWRRGETLPWQWPDDESVIAWDARAPDGPTLGWWVRVRRANGESGWVRDPRFECMGPLAGDEDCRG